MQILALGVWDSARGLMSLCRVSCAKNEEKRSSFLSSKFLVRDTAGGLLVYVGLFSTHWLAGEKRPVRKPWMSAPYCSPGRMVGVTN